MSYLPIENHGIIGNMHTIALVGTNGTIDWFCPEKFDAPSLFGAILDDGKGGAFQLAPDTDATSKQMYWADTNVLLTRFLCENGVVEIVDYMPVGIPHEEQRDRWLIRFVKMVRGSLPMKVICQPAFNYARDTHTTTINQHGVMFHNSTQAIGLSSSVNLQDKNGAAVANWTMNEGDSAVFSIQLLDSDTTALLPPLSVDEEQAIFNTTIKYWRDWLSQCSYTGRWRTPIYRSALVLKLLTYEPTGAIVAAPTSSLPEKIGGSRNWDYRYTWIRDAAFTVYAFMRIGFTEEVRAFVEWIGRRLDESHTLQVMYTINGDHDIQEHELNHLTGYMNSGPVRIGNAAHSQLQLDIYGELLDSLYLHNKYAEPITYDQWTIIREMLDWVCENWQQADKGIWEFRSANRPFVYSRVMLWVALDRGIRLAAKRSFPAPHQRWLETRDTIYEQIMDKGWNDELQAFTQYFDGDTLDASNLVMPLVFFMAPNDPRMLKTIEAINRPPSEGGLVSNGLVFRYNTKSGIDGLEDDEGTFNICTFWLVEALTRAGRLEEARNIFEKMMSYSNHLGLFGEETGPRGEALGNFPQAFTHLSLISAAFNLDRALNK